MGKIQKTAGDRHGATLSPVLSEFVKKTSTIPLRHLQSHLASFPKLWPFPRGDLYHWIPVLNRFDDILDLFIKQYGLDKGPQTQKFSNAVLQKGDQAGNEAQKESGGVGHDDLPTLDDDTESDCELVQNLLAFTATLLENCGNRSLYSSSDRLNELLNTTSLSLLRATLQLSLLLAKRYWSSKQRLASVGGSALLAGHYNISLDRVRRLAAVFPTPVIPFRSSVIGSVKGKEKGGRSTRAPPAAGADAKIHGADLVALVRTNAEDSDWHQWGQISMSFYNIQDATKDDYGPEEASPSTPSIRRTSNLAPQPTPVARSSTTAPVDSTSPSNRPGSADQGTEFHFQTGSSSVEMDFEHVSNADSEDLLYQILKEHNVPSDAQYELLHKIRTAKAISTSKATRCDLVSIRLLAVANLAYVDGDTTFSQKISQPDSEQPRQLQLAKQLAELVKPANEGTLAVPMDLQTLALGTLEGLSKQKSRANDVYQALNVNVNHGILFYVVRKAVAQLAAEESDPQNFHEEEWRHALFALLSSLPTSVARAGEAMMSAGLLDILVEILGLRTTKAERTHWKVLTFLDNFVYAVRDGYQSLANAKGLDVIKDLTSFTVTTSLSRAQSGEGMPPEFKAPVTDYQIPFFQQLTLRWLFKFINHLMTHNSANFGRQMRNLIDSTEVLDSLRQVLSNADVYGSNVWAGAVTILTSFIHNEPTSYSVIAESRLGESFLASITKDKNASAAQSVEEVSKEPAANWTPALLPVSEAITAVPQAFQALCLNEAGMKLVRDSHALTYFFRIFESPAHVKTMEQDPELPAHLGSAFDELVRHQPTLKPEILEAVQDMVQRVGSLCHQSAADNGYGAKLWDRVDGKLVVAGGEKALKGRRYDALLNESQSGAEVDMTDVESAGKPMSMEQIHEKQSANHGPHPTAYLAVSARFFAGFLANTGMCSAFIENGGLEYALDFATSPCLPFSFDRVSCGFLSDELGRMFQFLVEQKPFIVLPAILKRVQGALSDLKPLLEHDSPAPFFAPFTKISNNDAHKSSTAAIVSHGTDYAKALVVINVLCGVLSGAFSNQIYGPRTQSNIFSQTNLADIYEDVVAGLGKLHSSCIWEGCLLANIIPQEWERETHIVGSGFGTEEVDNVLQIVHAETPGNSAAFTSAPGAAPSLTSGAAAQTGEESKDQTTESKEIRNTRVVRFLMYQAPHEISQFFQSLGKVLLVRRISDSYQKQNAAKVADQMAASAIEAMQFASRRDGERFKYWIVTFTSLISHLLIDEAYDRPTPQVVTLVLQSFKNQDGFATLSTVLDAFFTEAKQLVANADQAAQQGESAANLDVAMGGVKVILEFYARIINSKYVTEATQTTAMTTRSSDRDKADFFAAGQLLVELRMAVIKPAQKMWSESESAFMDKAPTSVVKSLVEILRIVLEGEAESGALSRSEKLSRRRKIEPKKWNVKNAEHLERLEQEFGRDLAMEGLFRCYDSNTHAREYCRIIENHERASRTPIPSQDITTPPGSRRLGSDITERLSDSRPADNNSGASNSIVLSSDDVAQLLATDAPPPAPQGTGPLNADTPIMDSAALARIFATTASRDASSSPAQDDRVEAQTLPDVITVEDLNDERSTLRESLIDRCLDVLNVHEDVTFELSDLITAAVSKASSPGNLRQEIGSTLLLSLTSLQMDEDMSEDEARQHSRKIASYAHLFALVVQDNQFYTAVRNDLYDNFSLLVGFIKAQGTQKTQETTHCMAQILLILERLLSDDAQPEPIEYKFPNPDSEVVDKPRIAELRQSSTNLEEKEAFFHAILDVLPHVGKDSSLALSIARVLVILTRDRPLATALGLKINIRRLFSMIKQLHGTNDKLQSAFLLVLRHVVEDDETIRNIMRSEIQAMFETRSQRPLDTTSYTRNLYHLVIRSPAIFVEVTNEKVMLSKFDHKHGPQNLTLKKDPLVDAPSTASQGAENENTAESSTTNSKEMVEEEKPKHTELKMPEVKHPDGVIHFILGELLGYKDVDDVEPVSPSTEKDKDTDVEMANAPVSISAPPPTPHLRPVGTASISVAPTLNGDTKKPEKAEFKAENHPIYIYRCFLLQCLTELLSCYNRTKVEFINFKRKAEPQATTPSKPRSSVLNYLLNNLIPTGTLSHAEDIPSRKRSNVSSWAMSVVVSLCSKTGESSYTRPARGQKEYEEEPELLFVRKFVLEHAIRAFRDAQSNPSENLEHKYSRLLNLADLFNRMLTGKPNAGATPGANNGSGYLEMLMISQRMLAKIMYEKNFISALTASIADVDLNFPGAKRAVKYILRPLKLLTQTANEISLHSDNPIAPGSADEDEISSESSVSEMGDTREETPDLFRNSALGILDPGREDDTDSDDDDEDEDEEMYDEEDYDDQMDYDDGMPTHDHDEVVSDEEHEIGDMGPVEGLAGDVGMDIIPIDVQDLEDGEDMTDSDDSDDMDDDENDLDEDGEDMEDFDDAEDGDRGSIGADDEDWGTDEGDEEGYPDPGDMEGDHDGSSIPQLDNLVRVLEGRPQALLQRLEEGDFDGELPPELEYIEEEMPEEDEEDEEDYDDEDVAFEPELDGLLNLFQGLPAQSLNMPDDEEIEMRGMPWGWDGEPPTRQAHHHHMHAQGGRHGNPWGLFTHHAGDPHRMFPPSYRSHRPVGGQRATEDGTNPLLQRQGQNARNMAGHRRFNEPGMPGGWGAGLDVPRPGRMGITGDGPVSFLSNLINMMTAGGGPAIHHHNGTIHLHIGPGMTFPGGPSAREIEQALRAEGSRRPTETSSRTSRDDPSQAVNFTPTLTAIRWQEEARILFNHTVHEMAVRVINAILQHLVPPAIEAQKRREKEEAERQQKLKEELEAAAKAKEEAEQKEREEKETREKKEKEEREKAEAEAAAARSQEQVEAGNEAGASGEAEQMEGVEQAPAAEAPVSQEPEETVPRVTISIEGREIDITHLGIDREYLEALPDELRREVLMEQTLNHHSQATSSGQESSEISPEFLEALPPNLREEIVQQEMIERRRREREEARRRAAASGAGPATRGDEMDSATFFATLDPQLRAQLLMEVDEEALSTLTPELQAEARALAGHHRRLDHYIDLPRAMGRGRGLDRETPGGAIPEKRKPTQYVQILDKAGVATLLRLMFTPQHGNAKQSLNGILRDVCHNKQNRAEVVSILLSILQDGSNDINAVERSFAHLTLRAKQPTAPKTPQPKRASPELTPSVGEMSPLMVVQQCLSTLEFLTQYNPRIAEFFLTEHETGTGFKPRSTRKGKGKETKTSKFPINALLGLLDRKLVIESAPVMEQLASLLQRITHPLLLLLRKDKEKEKAAEEQKASESAPPAEEIVSTGEPAVPTAASADIEMTSTPEEPEALPFAIAESSEGQATGNAAQSKPGEVPTEDDKTKKHRTLMPPEVPEYNLRLIINIIAARECPGKTFKDTLSLITNLSTIPEAKEIFGQELIHQAQGLGQNILSDLEELSGQISKATSGTDVQGMALAKFSPASSDQAKLLRVITALDFLFDPKRSDTLDKPAASNIEGLESQQKEDILTTLYENSTFGSLWNNLSECLTAIRKRGNMFNVANILLPLIEVLMVVCKNTTLKDAPITMASQKEFALSSPEPETREARMENLFFTFTEEHRKVLNDLVRHNPKLMSGSFSLLVKNSKVLEFDNKRNYFTRKLHSRSNELRQPHPSLQLQVRRDQVFLDSFKSLYYKKPDEFKYGKLSIRFSGEEGVDAGGVTREWFQVLTKQMFDPNYALFNPVASDRTTFHPNSESGINEQHLMFFKFIGRIIGKALYENRALDCHFSRAVYKRVLGKPISIKDMESLDLEYYQSLQWILDNDITDVIEESFSVSTEAFGETKVVDLCENGRNILVTQENKKDYVRLIVEHKLIGSVKEQLDNFLQGFHDIVAPDLIAIFNEQELELLISGLPDIDVDDWKNNSEYHNYQASSPQIQWFWRAVRSFEKEERAKLLQFVTGTSKVPLNGFKELEGMNGFSRFNIHRDYGSKDRLPSSHTCFNQLDLPEYDSYEDLRKALLMAVTAGSEYFGFA